MQYSVIYEPDVIDEQFGYLSPFRLSKDVKYISDDVLKYIAQNIADELKMGARGKTFVKIYVCQQNS